MDIKKVYADTEDRMQKTIDAVQREFASIRTGKASASLLEGIKVDYYGNMTPLSQVASITIPDPKLLVIQPWEKRLIPEIAKVVKELYVFKRTPSTIDVRDQRATKPEEIEEWSKQPTWAKERRERLAKIS